MVWTYNKKITAVPGIRLNFSKLGISSTVATPVEKINHGEQDILQTPSKIKIRPGVESNIFSADIHQITSEGMMAIKEAIMMAYNQRQDLLGEVNSVKVDLEAYQQKLKWSYYLIYGLLSKSFRLRMNDSIANQQLAIESLNHHIADSNVDLQVTFEEELSGSFNSLVGSFLKLSNCKKIWDLTAAYRIDQFARRSSANTEFHRTDIKLKFGHIPQIKSEVPAMVWENANGADLYFYPNFLVSWNNKEEFAIIGIDEIDVTIRDQRFLEEEDVPTDTQIIDRTWAKVNKDGSPDRRFNQNYQIPIVLYSKIEIKTKTGLNELYQFSNPSFAESFVKAFLEYQIQVIKLDYLPTISQ